MTNNIKIEDLLRQAGLNTKQIEQVLNKSKEQKINIMQALEESNFLPEQTILQIFAKFYGVQIANLREMDIPANIIALIPKEIAEKNQVIPIDKVGNNLILATINPHNNQVAISIRFKTGYTVKPVLASHKSIVEALHKYYPHTQSTKEFKKKDLKEFEEIIQAKSQASSNLQVRFNLSDKNIAAQDGAVAKFASDLLRKCVEMRASDIHIEPYESFYRVRFRIDGTLIEISRIPLEIKDTLTTRIKIMAKMDIAERRLPQDGGIRAMINNKPVDFRVNSVPTIYGEKIVLRLLDKSSLTVDMTELGFDAEDLEKFMTAIHKPHGIVLLTGPTGSGKTTTLYSALAELNKETDNIMTAEDPVEYNLEGINQVQINPDIKFDFADALRAFLRQDPDVIMVGEIRDFVTGEIAIKAALTGHLVLSTLHTNSAAETIIRLQNMGLEPFNIASSLNLIVAQRLVKKVCEHCKVVDDSVTPDSLIKMGIHPNYATKFKAYVGRGCEHCNNLGTKGRIAIHEVMVVDEKIKEAILSGVNAIELKKLAMANGMKTLRQSALSKMIQGIIPASEVLSKTSSDFVQGQIRDESEQSKTKQKGVA